MNFLLSIFLTLKKAIVKCLEYVLICVVAALVLDVLWGVFSRYLLGEQSSWTEELACMLLIWVVLLGSAYAFGEKAHLGVDYLMEKFDNFSQTMVTIVVNLVSIIFASVVFIYGGIIVVGQTFKSEQMMMAIGLEKGYVYLVVPITGLFFVLFGLEAIFEVINKKSEKQIEEECRG